MNNTVIKKNIATIFRKINLAEYKSPDDNIVVADFYKVCSYAYLYACLEKIPITALTISFIGNTYPRKLFQHLKNFLNYQVEEKSPGIYTVKGDKFPIQIIDSRKLSENDNLWLRSLSNQLNYAGAARIIEEVTLRGKSINFLYGKRLAKIKNCIFGIRRQTFAACPVCQHFAFFFQRKSVIYNNNMIA